MQFTLIFIIELYLFCIFVAHENNSYSLLYFISLIHQFNLLKILMCNLKDFCRISPIFFLNSGFQMSVLLLP